MKNTTFNRKTAAFILVSYREVVRKNLDKPTIENWTYVCHLYNRVSTLCLLGILSKQAQKRASDLFDQCIVVI